MEEIANTLVEGYKKAKAAIEDLAENLVDNEDLYDKACAALKRADYETLDEVISMVSDEGTILHLLHKCCQLADVRAVSIMCQPPGNLDYDDDTGQIEWSPTEVSRRRDILCSLHNRQEVVETAIDSLIRFRHPAAEERGSQSDRQTDRQTDRHRGDPEACLRILIGAGFSVTFEDDISLLQLCIRHQNLRMLKFLLRRGCRANTVAGGATPLMHVLEADAVARNKAEALLMELSCDNERGCNGSGGGGGTITAASSGLSISSSSSNGGGFSSTDYFTQQSSSVVCSPQCVGRGGANLFRAALCYRGGGREQQGDHSTGGGGGGGSSSNRNWASPIEVARFNIVSPTDGCGVGGGGGMTIGNTAVFGEMFRVLVRAGADVNAVTPHGSVLHCAVETLGFGECAAPYYLQLPAYVISSPGLDPNTVDDEGRTALHLALSSRRFEAARQILNLPGVDVNTEDALCFTPLHLISWNNNPSAPEQSLSLMLRLFTLGADINQSPSPFHPITVALENCLFDHVTFLVKHAGTDLELNNEHVRREWDYFSISMSSNSQHHQNRGAVVPNINNDEYLSDDSDHVNYILRNGLSINSLTLAAMIRQTSLTTLMLKCLLHPRRHLLLETVRAWCVVASPHELPIRVWYLDNLTQVAEAAFVFQGGSLFDRCRIKIRRTIGCVNLHAKIDSLPNVPDKVKRWLKLESL